MKASRHLAPSVITGEEGPDPFRPMRRVGCNETGTEDRHKLIFAVEGLAYQRTPTEAHELFNHPSPLPVSKTYMRDMREKLSAETAMLIKIRQMAQTMGGALGQPGNNKNEDVEQAEAWMKKAEQQLGVAIPRVDKQRKTLNKKASADLEAERLAGVRAANAEITLSVRRKYERLNGSRLAAHKRSPSNVRSPPAFKFGFRNQASA